ncbi:MAG: tRNA (adenosine(37)-N6)-threonylcarbamoyltransferase complex ATPase subunit type 1 TsaE [Firmicutes bacterium]|nr:tRNA (adenosine(37)-N6)-threonylcarbamoyltransferase complex ATPase subunit type 1 TsaE [Bacillota bacterium]
MIKFSDMDKRIVLKNLNDTEMFGRELAEGLVPGSVVAMTGDLGTGKTTLAKAVAKGLGVKEELSSPTFTVVREYRSGRLPLYHFDVYRVYDPDELFELGFDEYIHGNGVCLIEWADLIEDLLPAERVDVKISFGENEDERTVELKC